MNTYILSASLLMLFFALASVSIKVEINYHRSSPHWLWVSLPPLVLAVGCLAAATIWHWHVISWEIVAVFGLVWMLVMLPMHFHLQSIMISRHTPLTGIIVAVPLFLLLHKIASLFQGREDSPLPWPVALLFLFVCFAISWQINRRLNRKFNKPEMLIY